MVYDGVCNKFLSQKISDFWEPETHIPLGEDRFPEVYLSLTHKYLEDVLIRKKL